jgi:hypothetical protein
VGICSPRHCACTEGRVSRFARMGKALSRRTQLSDVHTPERLFSSLVADRVATVSREMTVHMLTLQALLSSGNLADVEFSILPDKEEADADAPFVPAAACTFLAHRAVLVARSPFWATQFSTGALTHRTQA